VRMLSDKKAISVIIMIILLLCAAIFGALLSYMWAMANFYLEPGKANLAITNVDFSPDHSDYFYITVMNPSNSPSKTNITEISFTVNGSSQVYQVMNTTPETLPIPLEIATNKTIKCLSNWGNFAGNTITVHVSALNASGAVASVNTSFVKLGLQVQFDPTASCKQFNVTITNDAKSAINLTLTKLYVDLQSIDVAKRFPDGQNITISGINLTIGQSVSLQCLYDWENLVNPNVEVQTKEGYYVNATAKATASILLSIPNVAFNETNPDANEMSITVSNSNISKTAVDISDIVLSYNNGTQYHINASSTKPPFAPYYTLGIGNTTTFGHCIWNWGKYRNQTMTISVNVKQGFSPASKTIITPQSLVFNITDLNFCLNDTNHFLAKIANMQVSLESINVTKITVNGTDVKEFNSQIIPIGKDGVFNCTFDWKSFKGKNANITVQLLNGEEISRSITLPIVDLKLSVDQVDFARSTEGIPYVNITVVNSIFSNKTVNVTQIIFKTENITNTIDGALTHPTLLPNGYVLNIGLNVTILCPWNWTLYSKQNLTITMQTAEGFSISQTLPIP
jgi:hypothetical protein